MAGQITLLGAAMKGALAGLVGTAALTAGTALATNLVGQEGQAPACKNANQVGFVLLYGWVTAVAFRLISRGK